MAAHWGKVRDDAAVQYMSTVQYNSIVHTDQILIDFLYRNFFLIQIHIELLIDPNNLKVWILSSFANQKLRLNIKC